MYPYKAIKVDGKKIDEHRYVMEQHLGRKLSSNECVHHKDGDKRHNDLSNLEVVNRSEHTSSHMKGTSYLKGKASPHRLLSDQEVKYIRANYKPRDKTFGATAMGKKFGLSRQTIQAVAYNSTYK